MIQTSSSLLSLEEWFMLNREAYAPAAIKQTICKALKVKMADVMHYNKTEPVLDARLLIYYYLMNIYPNMLQVELEKIVKRDRTSFCRAYKRVIGLVECGDAVLMQKIELIQFEFNQPNLN